MKKTSAKSNSGQGTSSQGAISVEAIQEKAYHIWERKGRPTNSALEDWLTAEEELKSEVPAGSKRKNTLGIFKGSFNTKNRKKRIKILD